jgi:hypothetical protein
MGASPGSSCSFLPSLTVPQPAAVAGGIVVVSARNVVGGCGLDVGGVCAVTAAVGQLVLPWLPAQIECVLGHCLALTWPSSFCD